MDKILIGAAYTKIVKEKNRTLQVVRCPDCSTEREVRADMVKNSETTCCRSCVNRRRDTKPKEELFCWKAYYHSKEGKLSHIYQGHRQRSQEKGWEMPPYTREELVHWAMTQTVYHKLFDGWEASGFIKNLSPSIDRLDDYKPYSLENIRLVTWQENNTKNHRWSREGVNNKRNIAVDQLNMCGEFIARHHSISEAARSVDLDGSRIGEVCRGLPIKKGKHFKTPLSTGGFKWRYSTEPNEYF